jgi:NAD+ diphosphatase
VNNINYYASQAWPFPSQLMLAYTCDYESGDIKVDGSEIVDAKWFDLDKLPNVPPKSTLSGRLISFCISDR